MSPPQVVTMIWTKVIYFTIYKIFIVSHNFSLFITNTISPPPPTHSKLLMPTLHHIRHKKCTQPLGTVAITLKKLVGGYKEVAIVVVVKSSDGVEFKF